VLLQVSAAYSSTLSGQVAAALGLTQQGVTAVGLSCDGMPFADFAGASSSAASGSRRRYVDVTVHLLVRMRAPDTTVNVTVASNSSGLSREQLGALFNQYLEQLTPLADAALLSCDAVPPFSALGAAAQAAFGQPAWSLVGLRCTNSLVTATVTVVARALPGRDGAGAATNQQRLMVVTLVLQYLGGGAWQVVEEGGAVRSPPPVAPTCAAAGPQCPGEEGVYSVSLMALLHAVAVSSQLTRVRAGLLQHLRWVTGVYGNTMVR
jgi:hypothetical protein